MSKYTVEHMRDIQPVLEMFHKPEKALKFRLEEKHLTLATALEQDVTQVGVYRTYGQLNNLLIGILFKLKTIYHTWGTGQTFMTDHELRELVLALNYEIYESFLHTISIGRVYLPYMRDNKHIWDEYRAAIHVYIRRCHLIVPARFGNKEGVRDDIVIDDKERNDLIAGATLPTINMAGIDTYHFSTKFKPEQIKQSLDLVGDAGTIHPSVATIIKMCAGIEYLVNMVKPEDLGVVGEEEMQEQLLSLIELLRGWDSLTLAGLFKDEKVLLEEYKIQKQKDEKLLPYQLWRENQYTQLLTPNIVVAHTYC